MNKSFVAWLMAGAGVVLIYCAVKNISPASLLASYFTGSEPTPFTELQASSETVSAPAVSLTSMPDGNGSKVGDGLYIDKNGSTDAVPAAYRSTPQAYIGPQVARRA